MRWYVNQNGNTVGPLPEERIAMLVTWGKISRDAYICDEQFSTWVSITRTAFGPLVSASKVGADATSAASDPRSKRAGRHRRAWLAGAVLLVSALMLVMSAT
jgi:hypothetical protein